MKLFAMLYLHVDLLSLCNTYKSLMNWSLSVRWKPCKNVTEHGLLLDLAQMVSTCQTVPADFTVCMKVPTLESELCFLERVTVFSFVQRIDLCVLHGESNSLVLL